MYSLHVQMKLVLAALGAAVAITGYATGSKSVGDAARPRAGRAGPAHVEMPMKAPGESHDEKPMTGMQDGIAPKAVRSRGHERVDGDRS
jgi:hypothetical protein